MESDAASRRLAAILSADAVGYSRLMSQDEEATVRSIGECRALMAAHVGRNHGRVVDAPGDNLLAEFPSALDAARAALEIQRELSTRNGDLPESQRMIFRIGLHLGDILAEGERIYGDGVNIAARLESMAEPGGVCLSASVHDQIQGKISVPIRDLGEKAFKNIQKPVHVYGVIAEGTAPVAASPAEIPDKPSIAVLPFTNMSGDPEQGYFADGITEDLITNLSRLPALFVISRNSSFTYKEKPVKLTQVGRELGVRYVLEGSVRKAGDRVRITAQLIDAGTDRHLWAERYDRNLEDIFAVQDDVTREIVGALEVNIGERGEQALTKPVTDNLEAYDCFLRGVAYLARTTKETNRKGRAMLEQAIARDPNLAQAYALMAVSRFLDWIWQWTDDPGELQKAFAEAQQAVALDESISTPHAVLGLAYTFGHDYEKGLAEARKAVALNPNDADAQTMLGSVYNILCEPEEAIRAAERALRLDPTSPTGACRNYLTLGNAYRMTGRLDEAAEALKTALNLNPDYMAVHVLLASVYVDLDRMDEARQEVSEILRISPDFSLARVPTHAPPYRDPARTAHILESLGKAGLKE